ncbi:MAG: helix-turn-helix domain-containing protein [Acidimicrobiia bacterium]|nr:helix-turn-helix domain-containing protein [Acidimicrobiia bacterium]
MLQHILKEIRDAGRTVTLAELAVRMDTPVSALEPMIETLETAGLLEADPESSLSCPAQCRRRCVPSACPLTASLPTPLAVRRA